MTTENQPPERVSLVEYWNDRSPTTLFVATLSSPRGIPIECETQSILSDLVDSESMEWILELSGEVVANRWCWDGVGNYKFEGSKITNLVVHQ